MINFDTSSHVFQIIDDILGEYRSHLGGEYDGYRNHVCRVVSLCRLIKKINEEELYKIAIAGVFHDLGIWVDNTFDYIAPSVELAVKYLNNNGMNELINDIVMMITEHHKVRSVNAQNSEIVEVFRKADLIDLTLGAYTGGLNIKQISEVKKNFPNKGFHLVLTKRAVGWIIRHPLNPLPMYKW